ncbi:MAG TPA: Panacea domain-containing protein [Puia sp.]|nr:Panacea domain-containing protein [Puia sp.]
MPTYTKNQLDKIGNTLIYLCKHLESASKTHLLKLVFIIEEISIRKFGVPFFNIRFDVWKLGPVSRDLYIELTSEPTLLSKYIRKENGADWQKIIPNTEFSDEEFNDIEIKFLEEIVSRFKYCTAKELINYTHKKNSLWYNTAQKHGVLEALEAGEINSTDYEIDLSDAIQDDQNKLSLYNSYKEYAQHSKMLKS